MSYGESVAHKFIDAYVTYHKQCDIKLGGNL